MPTLSPPLWTRSSTLRARANLLRPSRKLENSHGCQIINSSRGRTIMTSLWGFNSYQAGTQKKMTVGWQMEPPARAPGGLQWQRVVAITQPWCFHFTFYGFIPTVQSSPVQPRPTIIASCLLHHFFRPIPNSHFVFIYSRISLYIVYNI